MSSPSPAEIVAAIALLESVIRSAPFAMNATQALSYLNGVCSHIARIRPETKGLSAGPWTEESYQAEGPDGEPVTVDPRANRLARNAEIAGVVD